MANTIVVLQSANCVLTKCKVSVFLVELKGAGEEGDKMPEEDGKEGGGGEMGSKM